MDPNPTKHFAFVHTPQKVQMNPDLKPGKRPGDVRELNVGQGFYANDVHSGSAPAISGDNQAEAPPFAAKYSHATRGGLVLANGKTGQACAVLVHDPNEFGKPFQLYGTVPYTVAQQPTQTEEGQKLYPWGTVVTNRLIKTSKSVSLVMCTGTEYRAEECGPDRRLLKISRPTDAHEYRVSCQTPTHQDFELCAGIDQDVSTKTWKVVVAPGVDQGLMLALTIALDVITGENKKGLPESIA